MLAWKNTYQIININIKHTGRRQKWVYALYILHFGCSLEHALYLDAMKYEYIVGENEIKAFHIYVVHIFRIKFFILELWYVMLTLSAHYKHV